MPHKIDTWRLSYSRDGFRLNIVRKNRLGVFLEWMIDFTDMDWFGKYKNIPFCWINPWGWTWRVGTEEHNLGGLWASVGHNLYAMAYRAEKEEILYWVPLTKAQVKEHFPDTWDWYLEMFDDEEDNDSAV
jgi:hypothetical protein